jgi:cellulose synthase/poly-beta-1,6-N-acetylglucosamine synthase-like glycosyltransferase
MTIQLIFFGAFGLLLYSYCLFPLLLLFTPQSSTNRQTKWSALSHSRQWPSISLLLAAHNEERVIVEKVRNFLDCPYSGKREMIIVSDGSTDRTEELARSFDDPHVRLIVQETRKGKGHAINRAATQAHGEILVFSDANAFFTGGTLVELIRPFFNPNIGLVTGCTHYTDGTVGSLYQQYEQLLKRLESRGGVVATADGAAYAMRRSLWHEHDPGLINDFLHPIMVNLKGSSAVIAPEAFCTEDFSIDNEFARQARMVAQASFVYLSLLPQLMRGRQWRSIWVLTSHKLLRWLSAPLLVLMAGASLWLEPRGVFYLSFLLLEGTFALLVAAGALARKLGLSERLSIAYQFIALNCAASVGLWRCLSGAVPVVWQPRGE